MSDFSKVSGSPVSTTAPPTTTGSTAPQKPLPKIPEPKTSDPDVIATEPKAPSKDLVLAKELTSPEVLQEVTDNGSTPTEIQDMSQELTGLKTELALSIGLTPETTVITDAPPPRLSDTELLDFIGQQLKTTGTLSGFTGASDKMIQASQSLEQGHDQLALVVKGLDETLSGLDKKKKAYNAPLYRLADKLGIKKRSLKLKNLEQQRTNAINSANAMVKLNQVTIEHDSGELAKFSASLRDNISQAKTDGKMLVTANKGNKGLIWRLGLQSKDQLRETVTKSLLSEMPNGTELLDKHSELQQDYTQQKDGFDELQAQVKLYRNRTTNFNAEIEILKKTDPKEADRLTAVFRQEKDAFELEVLVPIIEKFGSPDMIRPDGFINADRVSQASFEQDPPNLFDILSNEQQDYVDAVVSGISETLPNRVLDDSSVEIDGQKYVNKTFLAAAGFAKVYTYDLEGDSSQKIVVKVPHQPEEMSDDDFQKKVLDESVRELENHYQAMGVDGQGNPNLVKLIGAVSTEQGPLIAMEFVDGGDCKKYTDTLKDRLKSGDISPQDHETVSKYLVYQMMESLEHMHDRGMTHLDVKYDNFLIQSDGTVKVADFGLSKTDAQFKATRADRGDNPLYLPPEVTDKSLAPFADGRAVSNKIDSWSVGVMAHEMLFGGERNRLDRGFLTLTEKNVFEFGLDPNNRLYENPSSQKEDLMNKLMHPDPEQRLSLKEAKQHPYFNDIFNLNETGERQGVKQSVIDLNAQELNR